MIKVANENQKDFNAMLQNSKDMLKMQTVTDQKTIDKYGGDQMFFAPPIEYDRIMKKIPCGKVITVDRIREYLAEQNGADFTEPMTAGIFVSIAAWASFQRTDDETPYWRTLKANGELNPKYPGEVEEKGEQTENTVFDDFDDIYSELDEKEPLERILLKYARENLQDFA